MTAANIIQKIAKNFKSELRVSYLGVELHAVYFLFFVFIGRYRAGFRFCGYFKALRHGLNSVRMAHPNYARFINVGKNFRLFFVTVRSILPYSDCSAVSTLPPTIHEIS